MSFNSFSTVGKGAMLGSSFVPEPTSLAYDASSATVSAVTITFSMQSIPGITTYVPSIGQGSGTPSAFIISTLAANSTYSVTLVAKNRGVSSKPSSPALSVTTIPSAPVITYSSVTINSVVFTFPALSGTYTGTMTYTPYIPGATTGSGGPTGYTIATLASNTYYSSIYLTAANTSGTSANSNSIAVLTIPAAPVITYSSATAVSVTITFPALTGNYSGVLAYAAYIPGTATGSGGPTGYTISSLSSNTTYSIYLTATNSTSSYAGTNYGGGTSATSNTLSVLTVPGPPTALTYTSATSSQIVLSFTAPTGNGTITSYASNYAGTGSSSAWTIGTLSSNTYYSITMTATNASGTSSASSALSVLTVPAIPTSAVATITDATNVSVAFIGDANTGATITYTVTSDTGSFSATGTSSPITVTGTFVSGTTYAFTVTAKNTSTSYGGGTSPASSASSGVVPNPIPAGPTVLVTTNIVIYLNSTKGISGSTWTDQTGNGYNYTFYNSGNTTINYTTTTVNGGQVVSLDGTNYLWNSSGFGTHFKSSFTYEMWVYPTETRNATLIYENGQNSFGGWSDDQMGINNTGYFTSYVYNGGTIINSSGAPYAINNWYQIVNVYDNTAKVLYQYVNGVLKAQKGISKSYPGTVYLVLGGNAGNTSSYMNGLGYFKGYIKLFRGYDIALSGSQVLNNYNATISDGLSSATAAPSAAYLTANGNTTNGVYWINLPTAGAKQIYCILDPAVDGGGWMMAMKATKGTTFQYSANYWTTVNTLNPTDTNRNDGDAKFDTMNYSPASDLLALWPDLTSPVGGSLTLTGASYSCWSWLQNRFTSAGIFYGGTGNNPSTATAPSGITAAMTLIDWFNKISSLRYFIQDAKTWAGWGNKNMFSSQKDVRFYGFNYLNNGDKKTRWGFGWNENGDYNSQNSGTALSLFPKGDMGSDDVFGGIGMASNNYSAGDYRSCCEDYLGFNRQARVEIYIRDSSSSPSAPTSVSASGSGSTATITFTGSTGASYYTAFSNTGGFYGSSTTSPITITGLTTSTTYTFTVKASGLLGTSPASAASGSVAL